MVEVPDSREQVLALAAGRDTTQLDLSAAEGYLLSRIDGATPWRLLREIGGIPPDDVDRCVSRWIEEGVLDVVGNSASRVCAEKVAGRSEAGDPAATDAELADAVEPSRSEIEIDEGALDEHLDLPVDVQRRILEFEASLGLPYHELLGVQPLAEQKCVKRAYFQLSKEFHPDRYFRKEIGTYAERLDRIFKKVLEAHEILSDPELCRVENQSVVDAASAPKVELSPDPAAAPSKPLSKLERLRQRMPFKIDHAAIAQRRSRADEIFRAAQVSQQAGRLQEAEASIRIAISFDPSRSEFKEALGSLRIAAAGARASRLLASPSERMSDSELREALSLLEDVLPYRPHDPELNERAARVCVQLGKLDDAQEYAETLLERSPERAVAHTLVGRILREQGHLDPAAQAYEMALKIDEEDLEARRALASLRIGARDAARGGNS
ncbi:MAG: tetratricopeptide repeat protein [bacterium]|nr:tetratricopeptide repeat protein [bacterium]